MDKLLPIFNFLKNNRFWLTCGLLAATMIGIWFMATSQLAQDTKRFESDIGGKISSANGVISTTSAGIEEVVAHPNDATIAGMNAEIEQATNAVLKGWQLRYDLQKDLLVWPADVVAYENFARVFRRYDPPETFPTAMKGQGMRGILGAYKEHIPKRMNSICEIIGTEWKYADEEKEESTSAPSGDRGRGGGRGGRGAPPGMGSPGDEGGREEGGRGESGRGGGGRSSIGLGTDGEDMSVAVKWDEANQDLWHEKLTQFKGFDDNPMKFNTPTPLQVYMLQQDLWLMEAMFNIIKDVNGNVKANDLAKIKRIDHLVFGREARAQLGEVATPDRVSKEMQGGKAAPAPKKGGRDKRNDRGRSRGTAKDGEDPFAGVTDEHNSPFHGRYVNALYEPVTGGDVRKLYDPKSTELPDKNLEMIIARRVPVRIAVRMDERYIPNFLAASARSPFAFEVNQVRINKHVANDGIVRVGGRTAGSGGGGGGEDRPDRGDSISMGGMSGGGAGLDGGGNTPPPSNGGGGFGDEAGPVETRTHFNVDVEFYGIVKIYNPVNRRLLTGEEVAAEEPPLEMIQEEDPVDEAESDVAAPAEPEADAAAPAEAEADAPAEADSNP